MPKIVALLSLWDQSQGAGEMCDGEVILSQFMRPFTVEKHSHAQFFNDFVFMQRLGDTAAVLQNPQALMPILHKNALHSFGVSPP